MRKDELKSNDYCSDCVEAENGNVETDSNAIDECCCCCCSCSDTASEADSSNAVMVTEENRYSLEQQKKDLLSKLTVIQTNREPASVQHVLQFVEALAHSPDFLRRYNLLEDFCVECLLSEPTCTCCTNGISQLNLIDQSCDSCDECNSNEDSQRQRYPSQECPDCTSSTKASNSVRQRPTNRRDRRRRRRRRNIRHNLPRISTQVFTQSSGQRNSCDRDSLDGEESRIFPQSCHPQVETVRHADNCEECDRQVNSRRGSKVELKGYPAAFHGNSSEDSEFCEECARENLPSTSCGYSCCGDCESKNQRSGISSSYVSADRRGEEFCECCRNPSTEHSQGRSRKHKKSDKPECDQNEMCSLASDHGRNQSAGCSCSECQSNSECSDESCDECGKRDSKRKK